MSRKIPIELQAGGNSLYASEAKVYPREVRGRLDRLRRLAVFVLLGMYYLAPWINWGGHQAVLFDLPARKFYILGLTFWPQDFILLSLLLMIAAYSLFFFTALAGRLWCGYACPQTVWTETFLWIEQAIEGDRNKRMKLDAGPWTREKLVRKGGKHAAWLLFALWTGFTFVGFFTPIRELAARTPFIAAPGWGWGGWETFWILFYSLATWGNAGFLREQVCKYMCPYARFQSAMFDRNTLIIAYDPMRGEPRGPRKKGIASVFERARGLIDKATAYDYVFRAAHHPSAADARAQARGTTAVADAGMHAEPLPKFEPEQLGDCVDCTICVQVCPTGIDIRNGLQYECIACGACIDACDEVMAKVGYPKGLIRYTTQNAIDGQPGRVLRPRILVYGALLVLLLAGWGWGVLNRAPLIVEVLRDRNALYRETMDGIENGYTLKLVNKTDRAQRFRIAIEAPVGFQLVGAPAEVQVGAGQVQALPVTVRAEEPAPGRTALTFAVDNTDGSSQRTVNSSFFAPTP
jgi:polyferredoxin